MNSLLSLALSLQRNLAVWACGLGGAYGVFALYQAGTVLHAHYLELLGLDAGLFPVSLLGLKSMGSQMMVYALSVLLDWWSRYLWWVVGAVLLACIVWCLPGPSQSNGPATLMGWRRWGLVFLERIHFICFSMFSAVAGLFVVALLFMLPSLAAKQYARDLVAGHVQLWQAGCDRSVAGVGMPCVDVSREGKVPFLRARLVAASDSHVAFFDVRSQKIVLLPLSGLSWVSVWQPELLSHD